MRVSIAVCGAIAEQTEKVPLRNFFACFGWPNTVRLLTGKCQRETCGIGERVSGDGQWEVGIDKGSWLPLCAARPVSASPSTMELGFQPISAQRRAFRHIPSVDRRY